MELISLIALMAIGLFVLIIVLLFLLLSLHEQTKTIHELRVENMELFTSNNNLRWQHEVNGCSIRAIEHITGMKAVPFCMYHRSANHDRISH